MTEFTIPGTAEVAPCRPLTPGSELDEWRHARAEHPDRWPVVIEVWGELADVFDRCEYGEAAPAALLEQAKAHQAVWDFTDLEDEGPTGQADGSAIDWFPPSRPHLVLLPVRHGWEVLAYLHFYEQKTVNAMAILRSWHERFGAELVCHYGTMLQFVVSRPPTTEAEAWQLAREQATFAPCTTLLPGLTVGDLAQLLRGRPTWFIHERP